MGSTRNRPDNIVNRPAPPSGTRTNRFAGENMIADQSSRPFFGPPGFTKKKDILSGEESRDIFEPKFTESTKETRGQAGFFSPDRPILTSEGTRPVRGQRPKPHGRPSRTPPSLFTGVKQPEARPRPQTGFFTGGGGGGRPTGGSVRPKPPMGGPGINRDFSGLDPKDRPIRQVTKVDEFGQKYGGAEKYNSETGKYEAQYTKPPKPASGEVVSRRIPTKGERGHSRPPRQRP